MQRDGYKVLVDLDAILDTRLGALGIVDQEVALEIGQSRNYVTRETDKFSDLDKRIDDVAYRDVYLKRGHDVLKMSIMTDIPYQVGIGVRGIIPHLDSGLIKGQIEIHINTYPLKLSNEISGLIAQGVKKYIPDPVMVSCVHIDLYSLTPKKMSSKYDEWFAYDIDQWMDFHKGEILSGVMKHMVVTLPRLSTTGLMPEDEEMDPFSAKELIFSSFFKCVCIHGCYYSYNHDLSIALGTQSRSDNQSSGANGDSP